MIRIMLLALFAIACSSPPDPDDPHTILDNAIQQAGGQTALSAARALAWDGDATVFAGGRTVNIAGRWQVQPPDTAIVATYDTTRGPATTRAMVIAAPRGWMVRNDSFNVLPDPSSPTSVMPSSSMTSSGWLPFATARFDCRAFHGTHWGSAAFVPNNPDGRRLSCLSTRLEDCRTSD